MIFLLLHLLITTTGSGGSPAYTPPDHILHNCGGASEQDSNGLNWTSDAYYPECLPPNEPDKSVTFKAKAKAAAAVGSSAEYFLTRRLTTKSDVFAFGVVLFEVLSGRPALDMRLVVEQHSLATWAVECIRKGEIDKMFERCLVGQMSPACWKVFVGIAGRCLLREPRQRPHMADVVKNLELALALQQRAARN
ncbi:PREDICTED: receptor-like protein kinase FERONIA [Ipomoea nil]|uniref:receptor-like protein kinase FERONIA n=1 Tax=Ipomoea nil TaxID=35883 RepID=UPI000900BBEF|nr:PREDICTED: receptor-like protein kinase FERONIA [Ipomoea nil]